MSNQNVPSAGKGRETLSLSRSAQTRDASETRAYDTRSAESGSVDWLPPSLLPDPESPDPDYVYRWVRVSTGAGDDRTNVSTRIREGWLPVTAQEEPGLASTADESKDGTIKMGGLMLCKMPKARAIARRKYYETLANDQIKGVDNSYMRENNARMPLLRPERQSHVTLGGSRTE